MKLIIDLDTKVLDALKAKAIKVKRNRKQYIELLCISHAKEKSILK